ncbi:protein PIN-LIKES 3-like [Punica granatum]|uniref:Protein PIN-LIKES 3-like n=1 Tax=Punica granatum TaxID=22663 RepID=A0A6P8DWJ6_PUNGR|nr:protein PIN-LIKES 3-like [Punica granatum]
MGLLDIFVAALMPVLKVLLLTALGCGLAIDRVDILGEDARKHLNNVVFFVFNPALVVSNLGGFITYKSVAILWFMPLNILLTFIIGSVLGWMLIKYTRTPHSLRGLVLGCCAAGNLGNMPLIIIPAICKERGSPFGAADTCYLHGMAYASLSLAIGAIYNWSYVYNLVRLYSRSSSTGAEENDSRSILLSIDEDDNQFAGEKTELLPLQESSPKEDHVDQLKERVSFVEKPKVSILDRVNRCLRVTLRKINPRKLFAPSTIGAIAGFAIAIIPQLRKALIGDSAPLRVLQNSASMLGDAAIPTVTIVMGANLLKGLKGSVIQLPVVMGIVAVRYVALPMFGILIVRGGVFLGLVKLDPLYQFVLLLQFALPPAMNIATMTQMFEVGERECSVIMLWTYALASVALTFWSAFFMWLVA